MGKSAEIGEIAEKSLPHQIAAHNQEPNCARNVSPWFVSNSALLRGLAKV
jgi:hypothetical protein